MRKKDRMNKKGRNAVDETGKEGIKIKGMKETYERKQGRIMNKTEGKVVKIKERETKTMQEGGKEIKRRKKARNKRWTEAIFAL